MDVPIILSMVAIILTSITSFFSVMAYAKVVGLENSTHKIEYIHPGQQEDIKNNPTGMELAKRFMPEFEE